MKVLLTDQIGAIHGSERKKREGTMKKRSDLGFMSYAVRFPSLDDANGVMPWNRTNWTFGRRSLVETGKSDTRGTLHTGTVEFWLCVGMWQI